MFKIAICDDNLEIAQELEEYIQKMSLTNIETDVFQSGNELLKHRSLSQNYNIILLDIEMPSVNGIETAMELRKSDKNIIIIFVTAYKEYVYQIFEVLPFRFLEKPVSYEKLRLALTDAIDHLEDTKGYFFYRKGTADFQLPANEILYFEAANRKIKIHAISTTDIFYGKFKNLMGQLNPNSFLQVHHSFIINLNHIISFSDKSVLLSNNLSIPVSLKFRDQAREQHLKYIERRCGKW